MDLLNRHEDEKAEEPKETAETVTLIAAFKQALGTRVSDVRISKRLTDSACCIVNDGQMDRTLEKLLSRQKDSGVSVSAPVLEINPSHGLVKALSEALKSKGASAVEDAAHLLLDQATLLEGEVVADPTAFAKRLDAMMAKAFG